MSHVTCAMCGESKDCTAREIEGKEYDLCIDCWDALNHKLEGKGREIKRRMTVLVPPPPDTQKEKPETPAPHEPPKIWFQRNLAP